MTKLIVAYGDGRGNVSWFDVDNSLILMVLNESEHEQLSDGKKSIYEVVTIAEVALEDLINRTSVIPNGLDEKGRA